MTRRPSRRRPRFLPRLWTAALAAAVLLPAGCHSGGDRAGTDAGPGAGLDGSATGPDGGTAAAGIPGLTAPLPIDPVVEIPDNQWLLDAYRTFLGREHDPGGFRVNLRALEGGQSRAQIAAAFVASAEFQGSPALADRAGFVTRVYQTLLGRAPSAAEVASQLENLASADGSGPGRSWVQFLADVYGSPEYKATSCQTGYYTLGARIDPGALRLDDLFAGTARMQTIAESEEVHLTVPSATALWDQKLPVLRDPGQDRYIAFTRAYLANKTFNVALLTSDDAVHFTEAGLLFDKSAGQTFYDPHIAVDESVCPRRYVLTSECLGHEGAASLCTSQSTTPGWAETWTTPTVLVDGCGGNAAGICGTAAAESASTGTTLIDGTSRYVSWTQVYDGVGGNDPQAHTYTQGAQVASLSGYFGTVMAGASPIAALLPSEPQPFCTDAWDCNNRDQQDWKREGDQYYAIYNGANYYRCDGSWGVSIARAASPLGPYDQRLPLSRGIAAERTDTCGISYPVLNVIGGQLYIYYAYYPGHRRQPHHARAAGGDALSAGPAVPTSPSRDGAQPRRRAVRRRGHVTRGLSRAAVRLIRRPRRCARLMR